MAFGYTYDMGNPIGVKRDFDVLEKRRLRTATLLRKGLREAEVARRVGVHRQAASTRSRSVSPFPVLSCRNAIDVVA